MIDTEALRKKVIDLAIQGKLTEQLPSDGDAETLYAQIQEEKAKLIKEGKIKKEKQMPEITDDEIPFDIPDSWKWVRLYEISDTNIGLTYHPENIVDEGTVVLRSNNIKNGAFDYSDLVRVNCEVRDNQYIRQNDILICSRNGSKNLVGKCAIYDGELGDVSFGAFMAILRTLLFRYVYYYLTTDAFRRYFSNDDTKQINQVTQDILKKAIIPLPPIAEQTRIVDKLDAVLAQIDIIDDLQEKYRYDLATLKSKIIDAGIRGKLTEQLPEDGDAETLYAQIQEEKAKLIKEGKIKKEKLLPDISADEIPYEIPDNWKWVRLSSCISLLSGQDFPPEEYNAGGIGMPYMTGASNIGNGGLIINRWTETPKNISHLGDLLIVCKGSGYGKTAFNDVGDVHIARQFMAISSWSDVSLKYIDYVLQNNIDLIKGRGQGIIPGIDRKNVLGILLPLPPIEEQKRITKRIEELFSLVA